MFCPKCATQNVDGARFCRSCGANISLVPQALDGQLSAAGANQDIAQSIRRKLRREPSLDSGIRHFMMGLAFIIVSFMVAKYSPGGWTWWYWLLIPASTFIGRGISEVIRAPRQIKTTDPVVAPPQMTAGGRLESLPSLRTGELRSPVPSVTEGTTRHLGAEAATRHFDPVTGEEKFP